MTGPLRIGVAGLGTVGAALIELLERRREDLCRKTGRPIRPVAVSARSRAKNRSIDISGFAWHDDPVALAADENVDVVVELIGGANGPALATVEAALVRGKPVVTANKAMLAEHGARLAALAEANGAGIGFEAAVAGGIPIVKTLRESLAGNAVLRVSGILNGTCNYILTRMEREGLGFAECLAEAQRLGYAEADPSFDIEGHDTAHKLALLTSLAFGTAPDPATIYVEGITSITPLDLAMAEELGYRVKLLGVAVRIDGGIEQRVHPTMVPKEAAIAWVDGVTNAVAIEGDAVGELTLVGAGAGGFATASAVVSDIADLAGGRAVPTFGLPATALAPARRMPMRTHHGGYYVRLSVADRPGAAAAIATRMAEQNISLESIVQKRRVDAPLDASGGVPVVLITYSTTEDAIRLAVDAILNDGHIRGAPQVIRIEPR
jgi:homoserine dehydrogenase